MSAQESPDIGLFRKVEMPEPPQLVLFKMEEQWLYFVPLLNG